MRSRCAVRGRSGQDFQPGAGLLTEVELPDGRARRRRWVESRHAKSRRYYDPMLAQDHRAWHDSREARWRSSQHALAQTRIDGIETNLDYLRQFCARPAFRARRACTTRLLAGFRLQRRHASKCSSRARRRRFRIIRAASATGMSACRLRGRWMRCRFGSATACRQSRKIAAGLEITVTGPTLRFNAPRRRSR